MAKRKRQGTGGTRKKPKFSTMEGYKARAVKRSKQKHKKAAGSRSSSFTQKVQRVLSKNKPTGTYTKTYTGNLKTFSDNVYSFHKDVSRVTTTLAGSDFLAFDTRRVMDAVSVLFNGKTAAMNGYLTPGNLDSKTTKFRLQYASYKMSIKNTSDITLDVEIWAVDNKHQEAQTFVDAYTESLANLNQVGGATSLITKIGVNPSQIPQLAKNYNIKRIKKTLKPGNTCTYFTSIADRTIDFIQYWEGAEEQFFQKFAKQLYIRTKPTLSVAYNNLTSASAYFGGSATAFQHPVMVEITEKYKVDAPDDVASANENDSWAWFNDLPAAPAGDGPARRTVENQNYSEHFQAQKSF